MSLLALIILTGCVNLKQSPMNQEDEKKLSASGAKISGKIHNYSSFSPMTAGKMSFGLIGAAIITEQGKSIIKENDIKDPALIVNDKILNILQREHPISIQTRTIFSDEKDITKLANEFSSLDYILDTKTINWGYIYYPSNWAKYKVMYVAQSKLIDIKQKKVIAEGFCNLMPNSLEDAPSQKQLLDNNAALLKETLESYANICADYLLQSMFNINDKERQTMPESSE